MKNILKVNISIVFVFLLAFISLHTVYAIEEGQWQNSIRYADGTCKIVTYNSDGSVASELWGHRTSGSYDRAGKQGGDTFVYRDGVTYESGCILDFIEAYKKGTGRVEGKFDFVQGPDYSSPGDPLAPVSWSWEIIRMNDGTTPKLAAWVSSDAVTGPSPDFGIPVIPSGYVPVSPFNDGTTPALGDRDSKLVELVQYILVVKGQNIAVDGDFGPKTEAGLKEFQRKNGIRVDGIFGPQTKGLMENVLFSILIPQNTQITPASMQTAPVLQPVSVKENNLALQKIQEQISQLNKTLQVLSQQALALEAFLKK